MRSELLTNEPHRRLDGEAAEGPPGGPWEQCFDLAPGRSTSVTDRGARHLYWSLAEMLKPLLHDMRALAGRPLRGLVLGCDEAYLAQRMLADGAGYVLAIDSRPDAIERARWIRDRRAIDEDQLELRTVGGPSALEIDGPGFDIAIADGRADRAGAEPGALAAIAATGCPCALIAADRLTAAQNLTAAGFGRPRLLEPPADGDRRLIAFELNLMYAPPAPKAAAPGAGASDE